MNEHREEARQAAIAAREGATNKTQRSMEITESEFRTAVLDGITRYRKIFDSDSAMARHTGVSQPTVNKVLSGKQDPRLDAVGKLMDSAGAKVVFPWESKNETRKVALSSGVNVQEFRAVSLFLYDKGAVTESDATAAILSLGQLRAMSETLSVGAFLVTEDMYRPDRFAPGDIVLVDFARKPDGQGRDRALYLAGLKDGGLCIATAWDGKFIVDLPPTRSPDFGNDYDDVQSAAIGRVVMHMHFE